MILFQWSEKGGKLDLAPAVIGSIAQSCGELEVAQKWLPFTQDKAQAVAIYLDLYVSARSNIKDTFEEYQYMPLK